MRTKKFLFATTFAMMAACMMMNTSCTEYVDEAVDGGSQQVADKATVKLRFTSPENDDVSVSQSACLTTRLPYHACRTGCQRQGDDRPLHL
nr:MAG TPA: hypothetical protein [Caudoviricetes sp.]